MSSSAVDAYACCLWVRLADCGRRIANELLAAEADVAQWTGAAGTTVTGQLDIGHQIAVRVVERDARSAVADLHAGQVDIVLAEIGTSDTPGNGAQTARDAEGPATGQLRTALVLDAAYRIAVPADWPALDWLERDILVDELTRRSWITSARGSASHGALAGLTAAWQFTPRIDHECSELSSVVSLVAAGLGAAVIPQLAWADAADRTQLLDAASVEAAAAVASGLGARRIGALVRDTPRRVPAIELFLAALQRVAEGEEMPVQGS
ncbi:hypothetical protein BH23ACT10_BH23ACT10_29840 [soil metagenome]